MFSADKIQSLVESGLPGAKAQVRDMTGTSDHFELTVISQEFAGKGPVDRHRMVYAAIGQAVGNEIHALSLRTLTPEEAGRK